MKMDASSSRTATTPGSNKLVILSESEWRRRADAHHERVRQWTGPRRSRRSRGERHAVDDFLFEYYSFRPSQLERWHPGFGVAVEDPSGLEFRGRSEYREVADGVFTVSTGSWADGRWQFVRWLHDFLQATAERAGAFGCSGLHEWAMVYRADAVRHALPLRLGQSGTDAVVESLPIRCSHFDAFRFFTNAAAPRNRLQPTRETMRDFEQPACLHANMDLYKWAYKLSPFTASEMIAEAFELAAEIRTVDMRASPYDLQSLGYDPICIETPEGRAEYEQLQRGFAERARPLRESLIALTRAMLVAYSEAGVGVDTAVCCSRASATARSTH